MHGILVYLPEYYVLHYVLANKSDWFDIFDRDEQAEEGV